MNVVDGQARLRLYVARSTPNSVRAEHNLAAALAPTCGQDSAPAVEVIDVFLQPKRALTDGVVVTPTLIGTYAGKRIVLMGDLSDQAHLQRVLHDLRGGSDAKSASDAGGVRH